MNKSWEIFIKKAKEFNIDLTDKQVEQFKEYWHFLYEYNKHTNLVSSAELDIVLSKHFADSLSIGLLENDLNLSTSKTVLDIGIGGGFPGVPIIIAYPELKLCAVDSVGKKTEFLSQLSQKIEITDRIEIINSRVEELIKQPDKRESFDIAVSRAVSKLNVLLEYTLPFIKVGGFFVAYKAKTFQEEINEAKNALAILGGEVIKTANYTLSSEERKLILIKKTKSTPAKYPRKTGIPAKNPL
ncbi:MAG TPA: 16S rRNA (guanine(527)-N(7))-methyltransferase RsmG [Cyanobacteria bacterium UBA9971]|nr:16S rRNA (guanine(527)-N(7))-methyltransferase RsmG [Cyanobacteria bacterium UBA9971]